MRPCKHGDQPGACPYGSECQFWHEPGSQTTATQIEVGGIKVTVRMEDDDDGIPLCFSSACISGRCRSSPLWPGTVANWHGGFAAANFGYHTRARRRLRLQVVADFKPVLCNFVHRYVRERRLGLGIENIHASELLRGVGLPELRAACKEWLIGQRIMILADEMCDTRSCKSYTRAARRTTSASLI
jgi:hypothetical protein